MNKINLVSWYGNNLDDALSPFTVEEFSLLSPILWSLQHSMIAVGSVIIINWSL